MVALSFHNFEVQINANASGYMYALLNLNAFDEYVTAEINGNNCSSRQGTTLISIFSAKTGILLNKRKKFTKSQWEDFHLKEEQFQHKNAFLFFCFLKRKCRPTVLHHNVKFANVCSVQVL